MAGEKSPIDDRHRCKIIFKNPVRKHLSSLLISDDLICVERLLTLFTSSRACHMRTYLESDHSTCLGLIRMLRFYLITAACAFPAILAVPQPTPTLELPGLSNLTTSNTTVFPFPSEWPPAPYHHLYKTYSAYRVINFMKYGPQALPSDTLSITASIQNIIVEMLNGPSHLGVKPIGLRSGRVTLSLDFPAVVQLDTADVADDLKEISRLMYYDYGPREVFLGQLGPVEPWLGIRAIWSLTFDAGEG